MPLAVEHWDAVAHAHTAGTHELDELGELLNDNLLQRVIAAGIDAIQVRHLRGGPEVPARHGGTTTDRLRALDDDHVRSRFGCARWLRSPRHAGADHQDVAVQPSAASVATSDSIPLRRVGPGRRGRVMLADDSNLRTFPVGVVGSDSTISNRCGILYRD